MKFSKDSTGEDLASASALELVDLHRPARSIDLDAVGHAVLGDVLGEGAALGVHPCMPCKLAPVRVQGHDVPAGGTRRGEGRESKGRGER